MGQKKSLLFLIILFGVSELYASVVSVYNPAPFVREGAIIEMPGEKILKSFGSDFVVYDAEGNPMIYQVTQAGNILIESDLPAEATVTFLVKEGKPLQADTVCVGQIRNDFQDDFTWENDRSGYRLYGPSYRNGGGNVAGYDIWTKSVDYPVLAQRYADHCQHGISYHKDYGSGMDCYTVGKTLGAGMNALVHEGVIIYPCAYEKCEIIESGPLRTTAKITCYPETIGDRKVVEERIITLDKGSWLNKTSVIYKGLKERMPLVTGIVVHKQNQFGQVIDPQKRYVAYADLTDNPDNGNGVIYIGIVNEEVPEGCNYEKFEEPLGDAVGQILNKTTIAPGETYTYYWGSGWSKGGLKGVDDWTDKLAQFHRQLQYPIEVKVESRE